eukprot:COSAG01_NODE_583_length_15194_cov_5.640808_14_plen_114_part_00
MPTAQLLKKISFKSFDLGKIAPKLKPNRIIATGSGGAGAQGVVVNVPLEWDAQDGVSIAIDTGVPMLDIRLGINRISFKVTECPCIPATRRSPPGADIGPYHGSCHHVLAITP